MMKVCRRIGFVLAIASVMQLSLISCSDLGANSSSSASYDSATVEAPPSFESEDHKGDEFTFLIYNEHATDYTDNYIWAENSNGNDLREAVINRNRAAEEMFNIKVVADEVFSPKSEAIVRMQAGQCDFDVLYEWGSRTSSLALDGMLYDFQDLEHVDLSRSYWVPSAKDDLTIGGKMYIATNYITMNSIGWANFIYFNKTMYSELGYTESLYDLVDTREWTFDKFVDLAVSVSTDINGDGVMTSADQYGLWGDVNGCLTNLARYAGIQNTQKQNDGSYVLSIYNETAVNVYTNFKNKLDTGDIFIDYEDIWGEKPDLTAFASRYKGARFLGFGEGHVLFMPGSMDMTHEFVEMKDDYGVLPNPLMNSSQESYYHFVDTNAPMFSVPVQGERIETVGRILEFLAYKSEEYLLPAFFETTIKSKRMPDTMDYKMLDIVKNSIKYEWTELYGLTVTNSVMSKMMTSGSFKSVYNRFASKVKAEIKGCVTTLESYD